MRYKAKRIEDIKLVLETHRRTGYTTILNKVALENDIIVVTHNSEMFRDFNESNRHKLVSLNTLNRLKGQSDKPVFFDNAALYTLIRDYDEITADNLTLSIHSDLLESKIKSHVDLLNRIKSTKIFKLYLWYVDVFNLKNKFELQDERQESN